MIAIIDYGMGNLRSVSKAFETVGHRTVVTRDLRAIADADRVVLPGVGAFGDCMKNLMMYELVDPIRAAIRSGKPFLGICLGLQLLFTESDEFGIHKGLDVIAGRVVRFPWGQSPSAVPVPNLTKGQAPARPGPFPELKVPHMGWNQVTMQRPCPLFEGIPDGAYWYFVHSYYVAPADRSVAATTTTYGVPFVSSIWRDNVVACQFHPEKSQAVGLRLIKNFGAWKG